MPCTVALPLLRVPTRIGTAPYQRQNIALDLDESIEPISSSGSAVSLQWNMPCTFVGLPTVDVQTKTQRREGEFRRSKRL